jgi:hypothetical protein
VIVHKSDSDFKLRPASVPFQGIHEQTSWSLMELHMMTSGEFRIIGADVHTDSDGAGYCASETEAESPSSDSLRLRLRSRWPGPATSESPGGAPARSPPRAARGDLMLVQGSALAPARRPLALGPPTGSGPSATPCL